MTSSRNVMLRVRSTGRIRKDKARPAVLSNRKIKFPDCKFDRIDCCMLILFQEFYNNAPVTPVNFEDRNSIQPMTRSAIFHAPFPNA